MIKKSKNSRCAFKSFGRRTTRALVSQVVSAKNAVLTDDEGSGRDEM